MSRPLHARRLCPNATPLALRALENELRRDKSRRSVVLLNTSATRIEQLASDVIEISDKLRGGSVIITRLAAVKLGAAAAALAPTKARKA